jgi:hypothetical protein
MIGAAPPTPEQLAEDLLDRATVRVVEMSGVVARVLVELPSHAGAASFITSQPVLRGAINGPHCQYASTLTATLSLRTPMGHASPPGEPRRVTVEAAIPDPCFWTPQLPHRYRLKLELTRDNSVLARAERWLGLRPLSVRGRGLHFDGAGWVLRAVDQALLPGAELSQWRDESLALIVSAPDDELCERASQTGVLLVAELIGSATHIIAELKRLSRHAAVGLAIVTSTEPLDASLRQAAGGIILIQRVGDASGAIGFASAGLTNDYPWRQALLVDASNPTLVEQVAAGSQLPLLVERTTAPCATLAAARRACDTLQADTAGHGTFAGYVIRAAHSQEPR